MKKEVRDDLKEKLQTLIQKTSAGDLSVLLHYLLISTSILYGYAAFASFLRLFSIERSRIRLLRILENIQNSSNDVLEVGIYFIVGAMLVLILWLYLVNKKLTERGVVIKYSPTTSIWSWFVPGLHLILPINILLDTKKQLSILSKKESISSTTIGIGWLLFWLGIGLLFVARFTLEETPMHLTTILSTLMLCIAFVTFRKMIAAMKLA